MVRSAERTVAHTPAYSNDFDVGAVVADVNADLFQTPHRGKASQRIGKDRPPLQRQPCRETGHILLGDTDIQKLLWELGDEVVEDAKSQVCRDEHDVAAS